MSDALLGTHPAHLRVRDKIAPCLAHVGGWGSERAIDEEGREHVDGCADDFIAAADGKGLC